MSEASEPTNRGSTLDSGAVIVSLQVRINDLEAQLAELRGLFDKALTAFDQERAWREHYEREIKRLTRAEEVR